MSKTGLFFYKWDVNVWRMSRSRRRMNPAERYFYRELLDVYYLEGELPDDIDELASIADISPEDARAMWPKVSESFTKEDGVWKHKSADERIKLSQDKAERQSEGGRKGRQKQLSSMPGVSPKNAQAEQVTNNKKQDMSVSDAAASVQDKNPPDQKSDIPFDALSPDQDFAESFGKTEQNERPPQKDLVKETAGYLHGLHPKNQGTEASTVRALRDLLSVDKLDDLPQYLAARL